MNFSIRVKKNVDLAYFFAGLAFLFSALCFQWIFFDGLNKKNLQKHLEVILHKKEHLLISAIDEIKKSSRGNESYLLLAEKFEKDPSYLGLSFYVYEKDSLIYWSDNSIPIQETLRNSLRSSSPGFEKIGNCWVEKLASGNQELTYVGMIRVKQAYPFENEFLKNEFEKEFHVPTGTGITFDRTEAPIFSASGQYLFSLKVTDDPPLSATQHTILFLLFFTGFLLLLMALFNLYIRFEAFFSNKVILTCCILVNIILIRFVQFYFKVPSVIYNSEFFGPTFYSSSAFFPSLGDILVNSLLLLFVAAIFYRMFPFIWRWSEQARFKRYFWLLFLLVIVFGSLYLTLLVINNLVLNSTIVLDLQDISSLEGNSFVGFIVIGLVFLSFFLFVLALLKMGLALLFPKKVFETEGSHRPRLSFSVVVSSIVFFAVIATFQLNLSNERKEQEKRKLLAVKLGTERDPLAEIVFSGIEKKLFSDTILTRLLSGSTLLHDEHQADSLRTLIKRRYFGDFWNNYFIQITFCTEKKHLRIQPQNYIVGCNSYFQNAISEYGEPTLARNLFYLNYGYGYKNYIAYRDPGPDIKKNQEYATVYIELSSKLVFKDLGYPDLLVDKRQTSLPDITGYSYAFYRNNNLVQRVGGYHYGMTLDHILSGTQRNPHFYKKDGQSHYCYPVNFSTMLIISKKEAGLFDELAPFSYLFIAFSILTIVFIGIFRFSSLFSGTIFQLGDRLQVWMTGILVCSLIVIGGLSVNYIIRLNAEKNKDNLSDRAFSILVELQHKLGSSDSLDQENSETLPDLLTKLSNVFFTDVNLFSPEGRLLASSRQQIYEEKLISSRMNTQAYSDLVIKRRAILIQKEKIGTQDYYSAYVPFYNDANKLIGYLNVPAFARQEDLKREVSAFLVTFINSYVFIIIIGIFLSLVVSNYIIRPLRMLTGKISQLKLGDPVEKLKWEGKDEIGRLVIEYNRMTGELAKSADLLAKSERESAWRQMARQIAHEIKNPLTPMKLSVQHLEKAWNENATDWDSRLTRFTRMMTEQIDTLSSIASEFSDFAQMPPALIERLDLNELVGNIMEMYSDASPVQFSFIPTAPEKYINADRKQFIRVFTNLINNSIQAISDQKSGIIRIQILEDNGQYIITLEDNGVGIDPSQADRIFLPDFTTKTSGSGLGLAIVKSIILEAGGTITFFSIPGHGTTFTLTFPGVKENGKS